MKIIVSVLVASLFLGGCYYAGGVRQQKDYANQGILRAEAAVSRTESALDRAVAAVATVESALLNATNETQIIKSQSALRMVHAYRSTAERAVMRASENVDKARDSSNQAAKLNPNYIGDNRSNAARYANQSNMNAENAEKAALDAENAARQSEKIARMILESIVNPDPP